MRCFFRFIAGESFGHLVQQLCLRRRLQLIFKALLNDTGILTTTKAIRTFFFVTALLFFAALPVNAQKCPENIDFENGSFDGWTCYAGTTTSDGVNNQISFQFAGPPVANRHTMFSSNPGSGLDPYGDFPIDCPNGSGYSIKLGNDQAGTEAEGISYDFTVPANANVYNLIYNYAVVFQDPGHLPSEQPRLEIEIINLTDGNLINCSSFSFYAVGNILPGFELSSHSYDNTPVWFKNWTAVSVNLDGLAGKNIRLFFKTADCTFRRHFGYAYVDVNTECSDKFTGAEFCPDDSLVMVTAPYGYASYAWYNTAFTKLLGNSQTLTFDPPPPTGTSVAVILQPYEGYGCLDTLYTDLTNTLTYQAEAGPDTVSCNKSLVQLGVPPKAGWHYQWTPTVGLNNAALSNPLSAPAVTTNYVLTVTHNGGGCRTTDTTVIRASILDSSLQFAGKDRWCLGSGDSTVLSVQPAPYIQWFKNNAAIPGAKGTTYRVSSSGAYHAMLSNDDGCTLLTRKQQVDIAGIPTVSVNVNAANQCLLANQFVFTNNSTASAGNLSYTWAMGDGNSFTTRNLTYQYQAPGVYNVKLLVRSSSVCADSTAITLKVYPNVTADFRAPAVCMNVPFVAENRTLEPAGSKVSYLWDFGNGASSTLRNPPSILYENAGVYKIKLTVSSDKCPFPVNELLKNVRVDRPKIGENYPVRYAVVNLPLSLRARPIAEEVLWSPPVKISDATSFTPVFQSATEQTYLVTLKTLPGCITVDTQVVKISKGIAIHVPNAFTPNGDGSNDVLRPFMIGIKELGYFRVFNRWGQLIFQTSDMNAAWDGRFKGMSVEMQTVVWTVEGTGVDNLKYTAKGTTIVMY